MALKVLEPQEPYNTKEDLLELATAYKEAKDAGERNLWELSDLAHEAAEKYSLKEFAKATGENYNSLIAYSAMAGAYPKSVRETIREYSLSYRHYMVAKSSDSRLEWLKKAEYNKWSAERLRREMNPPKPVAKKELPPAKESVAPPAQSEPVLEKPKEDILQQMVIALNWYLINDKRTLELAAPNALVFVCLLLGEKTRTIVYNEFTGEYEISVSRE